MPTEYSWPRVRAILDTALESPRGVSIRYETWTLADHIRRQMYKIRLRQREASRKVYAPDEPGFGVSAYDCLTPWLQSSIRRRNMTVKFLDEGECREANEAEAAILAKEPERKQDETVELFPGKAVFLEVKTDLGSASVTGASFRVAWTILRTDFPCNLVVENGYNLDHLEITTL